MADQNYPHYREERLQTQTKGILRRKTHAMVWQDKRGFSSARAASDQPARSSHSSRAGSLRSFSSQSKSILSKKEPLVQLPLWVKPIVKEWTVRRAAEEGISASAFGAPIY